MACLARREHSQAELQFKLEQKGFSGALVRQVIVDFQARGLQSDARYAEVFIRSRIARGYGAARIRQELLFRGIDREVIDASLDGDADGQIERVYARKFGAGVPASLEERRVRERFLLRRGFSGDQIRHLFRRLRDAQNADGRIE